MAKFPLLKIISMGQTILDSDNVLIANRRLAIFWTNDVLVSWQVYMSTGLYKSSCATGQ